MIETAIQSNYAHRGNFYESGFETTGEKEKALIAAVLFQAVKDALTVKPTNHTTKKEVDNAKDFLRDRWESRWGLKASEMAELVGISALVWKDGVKMILANKAKAKNAFHGAETMRKLHSKMKRQATRE